MYIRLIGLASVLTRAAVGHECFWLQHKGNASRIEGGIESQLENENSILTSRRVCLDIHVLQTKN